MSLNSGLNWAIEETRIVSTHQPFPSMRIPVPALTFVFTFMLFLPIHDPVFVFIPLLLCRSLKIEVFRMWNSLQRNTIQ